MIELTFQVVFFGWLCSSIAVAPKIDVGLDQELSMPEDSFVLRYFQFIQRYLSIGPPVYFVATGLNYSNTKEQNLICGGQYCNDDSLSTQIFIASKSPNYTYIARPASSWLDDYFDWTSSSTCCRYFPNNGSFCPHESELFIISLIRFILVAFGMNDSIVLYIFRNRLQQLPNQIGREQKTQYQCI